jgi:hypothetical protein
VGGVDALLTVRGHTPAEFTANLAAIRGLLDAQAPALSPPAASAERRFCPTHGTEMQLNTKEGRTWWSHRHEGQWCKGRK